jgi:hypothetical protein
MCYLLQGRQTRAAPKDVKFAAKQRVKLLLTN